MSKEIIVEMTPFIFEDGNIYYFQIFKRESSNDYHDLYVYKKETYKSWYGKAKEKYTQLNERPELVDIKLNATEIKSDIKKIINSRKANIEIEGWDGFVGDVPEELKVAIKREANLKSILKE